MSFKDAMERAAHLKSEEYVVQDAKEFLTSLSILDPSEEPELIIQESAGDFVVSVPAAITDAGIRVYLEIIYRKGRQGFYKESMRCRPDTPLIPELAHFIKQRVSFYSGITTEEILIKLHDIFHSVQHYCRCAQRRQQEAQTILNNKAGKDTKDKERAKSAGRLEKLSRIAASRQKTMQELVGEWVDSLEEEESTQGKSQLNNEQDPDAYWLLDTHRCCSDHLRYETEANRKVSLFEKLQQIFNI